MAWFDELPDTLVVDGTPVKDHPLVKESPDLGHFVNKSLETHKEVGSRIPVRKPEKPEQVAEWRKNHLPKIYEAGYLERPPAKPEDYEIKAPTDIDPKIFWSDDRAKKFAGVLHKHGIPKAAVPELMELHKEALLTSFDKLGGDEAEAIAALKREYPDYDARYEQLGRMAKEIFTPEEMDFLGKTGLGNHSKWLSIMMKIAPLWSSDSSAGAGAAGGGGGTMTVEALRAEITDIMTNPQNSRYKLYQSGDPDVVKYIDSLYDKAYPEARGKKVEIQ